MHSSTFLAVISLSVSSLVTATALSKRGVDFINPTLAGGSFLDKSGGLGEPLNVIISAQSSPEVLTKDGFIQYAQVLGFDIECLGLHIGDPQTANLGDGNGDTNELEVLRENFHVPGVGTCLESLAGGNHFRVWPQAGTGALFLAVSEEKDVGDHHDIVDDGYNKGRDALVNNARGTRIGFNGKTFEFTIYDTVVTDLPGLLPAGSEGVNHGIAQDGIVKMLTVTTR
ncbi:hypothetical protein C8J57DRAFT_1296567 [Mycena rebaudengoi]|nr:hypothetical protein C8J57DRAFT_1296567 [Mycena rebaudengoi]